VKRVAALKNRIPRNVNYWSFIMSNQFQMPGSNVSPLQSKKYPSKDGYLNIMIAADSKSGLGKLGGSMGGVALSLERSLDAWLLDLIKRAEAAGRQEEFDAWLSSGVITITGRLANADGVQPVSTIELPDFLKPAATA
jgi:hypothetical protein